MHLANVEVERDIHLGSEKIFCDQEQLVQAFIALFVNAVEAMPEGGILKIEVEEASVKPDWIKINIKDTGTGIPAEILDKIFEPFFTTKQEKKGVGLGLPVVYGIIQRHQGKIRVESEKGNGSTFIIELPRRQFGLIEERGKGNKDETV
jgi:two-component system NtrC family sensor kinase